MAEHMELLKSVVQAIVHLAIPAIWALLGDPVVYFGIPACGAIVGFLRSKEPTVRKKLLGSLIDAAGACVLFFIIVVLYDFTRASITFWHPIMAITAPLAPPYSPPPPSPPSSPSITGVDARFVAYDKVGMAEVNNAAKAARSPRMFAVLWDLDSDLSRSLYEFDRTGDYLPAHSATLPENIIIDQNLPSVRPGDRIIGLASTECANCEHVNSYWIYFTIGQESAGWYSYIPNGHYPEMHALASQMKKIAADPERLLLAEQAPVKQRHKFITDSRP